MPKITEVLAVGDNPLSSSSTTTNVLSLKGLDEIIPIILSNFALGRKGYTFNDDEGSSMKNSDTIK